MFPALRDAAGAMPWLILALSRLANAACECGYSVNKTTDATFALYTELMENDFLHTKTENISRNGWQAQEYNVSSEAARGPYGKQFFVENIQTNPFKDSDAWSGDTEETGDPGLQMWIRGDHSHGYVSGAEMATHRNDLQHGSFRAGLKLSGQSGTCGAFFWFYNNSQEIDLEFLSKQFNESQGAVNLVLQTPQSVVHGYDASNTSEFEVLPLPFRPDEKYHEYRFDWTPGKVEFYVDGEFRHEMTENVPTQPGRMFFNHWSNGDPLWSAGPPGQDTAMTISYLKAYFNSTDEDRNDAYRERCPTFDPAKVCEIPSQTVAPDASSGTDAMKTYFFTLDEGDKTPGQDVFPTTNGASSLVGAPSTCIALLVTLFSLALAI